MDQVAGVDMSGIIVIAHAGQMEKTRAQNDAVVAAAKADPDHFYPIASANTPYPQYGTNSYLLSQPLR